MSRGDRREDIFLDDVDQRDFIKTWAEACPKTGGPVPAYCLMRTHYPLILETPRANLVAGMKWFLGTYTARFNRRHKLCGHLFSGRYKALFVDGSGSGYLKTVCDYVHLNPARAHVLKSEQPFTAYRWSSFGEYLKAPQLRAPWLRETTMSLAWVAWRLQMGAKTYLSHLLYWKGRGRKKEAPTIG